MTAPLTPHDQPFAPYPGGDTGPGDAGGGRERLGRELGRGALVAVLVAVGGIALGLLWLWLSPRIPMISDGQAVYLKDTEGEEAIGGDGTFVLIAAGLGVLSGLLVFWRARTGGVAVVLGLALGGALAAVIGWRLGVWLGPTTDIVAHAKQVGPKVVFDGPLELRAKSALVAWPAAAMLTHLCLTSAFPRHSDDTPGPPPPPDWH
ncbi:ABC transporter permease [Streptomyces sp. NBC_01190]|uniref:ABC transporter permease n=1 Tax=Streptomyces sp. NBC_01190 TaxID=2903767 RepID=UPI003867CDA8|nr:ABC transporter permease [Streptomyces sp. NBC_01190]